MSAPKWTPGPWIRDPRIGGEGLICTHASDKEGRLYLIECPGSQGAMSYTAEICRLSWVGTEEWDANAHLIAAAPEMYEALEALRYEFRGHPSKNIDLAKAALAKARGES